MIVLCVDFGSTFTKVTAVDLDKEAIIGTSKAFTTIQTDIMEGLDHAIDNLPEEIRCKTFDKMLACSSAAGGLKIVAVGLVSELTTEAAKRAALGAGGKVIKTYSYKLNKNEVNEIENLKPDILLLTGGTDGGNEEVILHNAWLISKSMIDCTIIVAGNKSVADDVENCLKKTSKTVHVVDNVMPDINQLNIEPCQKLIRETFIKKIVIAKGYTRVKKLIDGIVMPTPSAVLKASSLLSSGTKREEGLGEIMVIDVGGATTDVYSIAKGLPSKSNVIIKGLQEPYIKRTVEGDLGVRYNALSLKEIEGFEAACEKLDISIDNIHAYIHFITNDPSHIPERTKATFDDALAACAVKEAVNRHVGNITSVYTPLGMVYQQTGKDLTSIRTIIGTGGPLVNSKMSKTILENVLYEQDNPMLLKPKEPKILMDSSYIMAAMGLLSEINEDVALKIMKQEIKTSINGGQYGIS